jgi:hypothetical protein
VRKWKLSESLSLKEWVFKLSRDLKLWNGLLNCGSPNLFNCNENFVMNIAERMEEN